MTNSISLLRMLLSLISLSLTILSLFWTISAFPRKENFYTNYNIFSFRLFITIITTIFCLGSFLFPDLLLFLLQGKTTNKSYSDLLGYYGSIFGGIATILGVIITIQYEKEKEKISNRPILQVIQNEQRGVSFWLGINSIHIKLKNAGKSYAKNIIVEVNRKDIKNKNYKCDLLDSGKESDIILESTFSLKLKATDLKITYYDGYNNKYKYITTVLMEESYVKTNDKVENILITRSKQESFNYLE